MSKTVVTYRYYNIYDYDEQDVVWESPSASSDYECDRNLLKAIEKARSILRSNPSARIDIGCKVYDTCDGYEYGDECYYTLCDAKGIDALEKKVRK